MAVPSMPFVGGVVATALGVAERASAAQTEPPPVTQPPGVPTAPVKPTGPARPTVYLTFDDGPSPYTKPILRILTQHGATATFFQLGVNLPRYPGARRAIEAQGSTIGNHTGDHANLTKLTGPQIRAELRNGPASGCVRPPYGAHDPRVDQVIRSENLRPVLWTADSRDWTKPGVPAILRGSLAGLRPGSIILMHDGGGDRSQTVAALPQLLKQLHRRGYQVRAIHGC